MEVIHRPCAAEKAQNPAVRVLSRVTTCLPLMYVAFRRDAAEPMPTPPVQHTSATSLRLTEWDPTMHLAWTSRVHLTLCTLLYHHVTRSLRSLYHRFGPSKIACALRYTSWCNGAFRLVCLGIVSDSQECLG